MIADRKSRLAELAEAAGGRRDLVTRAETELVARARELAEGEQ